jgi:hypothetical protein
MESQLIDPMWVYIAGGVTLVVVGGVMWAIGARKKS